MGSVMKIGIVGTGKMGSAMAKRLLSLNHQVFVWNRSAARAQPLLELGARPAASLGELATQADLVITMLTDEKALEAVYFGAEGLLAQKVAGHQMPFWTERLTVAHLRSQVSAGVAWC